MHDFCGLLQVTNFPKLICPRGIMKYAVFISVLSAFVLSAHASENLHQHEKPSKYAGQEQRTIKSLSSDDIAELTRGGGWGLAKAAELNGVPGPVHLLELKNRVPLTKTQIKQITDIYKSMKAQAIEQGKRLIAAEQELEEHFKKRTITDAVLLTSLTAIAEARKKLRYIHLVTHLKTSKILSETQIKKYNDLRGYGRPDPCDYIPEGHSVELWRKHNGCQ